MSMKIVSSESKAKKNEAKLQWSTHCILHHFLVQWTCVHDIQDPLEKGSNSASSTEDVRAPGQADSESDSDSDSDSDSEIEEDLFDSMPQWRPIPNLWRGDWDRLWMPHIYLDSSPEVPESRVLHVSTNAGYPVVTEGSIEDVMDLVPGPQPLGSVSPAYQSPSGAGQQSVLKDGKCKVSTQARLLYYAQEPNRGRGWIKELCFSTDGRLVCSPLERGVRLLAFDSEFRELSDCTPHLPARPLVHVLTNTSHSNYVVSTKFSPTHCLLVSGCLNGQVCFHQPTL